MIMKYFRPILFLLPFSLIIVACSHNTVTVEDVGLAGTWEVDLTPGRDVSTLKGQVNFTGNRYIYTWYQLKEASSLQTEHWVPIEMEQGNIVFEQPGVMALLADFYGVPELSDAVQSQGEIGYKLEPSKSDYLIHYEVQNNQLVWKEDSNLDGDFDDVFDFPETMTYTFIE
jgi:hypothetical protein